MIINVLNNSPDKNNSKHELFIECENTHHRSIALNESDRGIRPGQRFNLKAIALDTPEIKNAISQGMIKVISSASHKSFADETTVNIY